MNGIGMKQRKVFVSAHSEDESTEEWIESYVWEMKEDASQNHIKLKQFITWLLDIFANNYKIK